VGDRLVDISLPQQLEEERDGTIRIIMTMHDAGQLEDLARLCKVDVDSLIVWVIGQLEPLMSAYAQRLTIRMAWVEKDKPHWARLVRRRGFSSEWRRLWHSTS
jgi:hypothetical protein